MTQQTHHHNQESNQQKSAKPTAKNAQPQTLSTPALQKASHDPGRLAPGDVLQLQQTIGNRATGKVLAQARLTAAPTATIQRVRIPNIDPNDPSLILDTALLNHAQGIINTLWNKGKRQTLQNLFNQITQAQDPINAANNQTISQLIQSKLNLNTGDVPENAQSGWGETAALKFNYLLQTASDPVVQAGLRMWVSGDPQRGINWNMIGKHLRGRLTPAEYQQIGTMNYLLADQSNQTNLEPAYTLPQREQAGRQLLDAARNDIRGALDALPTHEGVSFRQAGVLNGTVYGGLINVGDYIRDTTFWSTSALRISGSAGGWGQDGTLANPKVYFIINGTTGKYIAKYSGQEEGQHEVLFKDLVTFQVNKIANFRNETFFVHVTEVDPATIPPGTAPKNPYNGT